MPWPNDAAQGFLPSIRAFQEEIDRWKQTEHAFPQDPRRVAHQDTYANSHYATSDCQPTFRSIEQGRMLPSPSPSDLSNGSGYPRAQTPSTDSHAMTPSSEGYDAGYITTHFHATPDTEPERRKRVKGLKEKANRAEQAEIKTAFEDMLELYLGWHGKKELTGGNANRAGLVYTKAEVDRVGLVVSQILLHDRACLAAREGRSHTWQGDFLREVDGRMQQPDLHSGTFLQSAPGDEACAHDGCQRRCLTHAHADHRTCRKGRMKANFQRRFQHFCESVGIDYHARL